MTEADDILFDIEQNLMPLLKRYMDIHADRWANGNKESGNHLKTFQRSLVQHVYKRQPLPLMEDDGE